MCVGREGLIGCHTALGAALLAVGKRQRREVKGKVSQASPPQGPWTNQAVMLPPRARARLLSPPATAGSCSAWNHWAPLYALEKKDPLLLSAACMMRLVLGSERLCAGCSEAGTLAGLGKSLCRLYFALNHWAPLYVPEKTDLFLSVACMIRNSRV